MKACEAAGRARKAAMLSAFLAATTTVMPLAAATAAAVMGAADATNELVAAGWVPSASGSWHHAGASALHAGSVAMSDQPLEWGAKRDCCAPVYPSANLPYFAATFAICKFWWDRGVGAVSHASS
jgi:hypothetical protein